MFTDEDIRELNAMYWAEEEELKAGIHPTQIIERVEKQLEKDNIKYTKITFMNYHENCWKVDVSLDGEFYKTFDYDLNVFE